MISQGWSNATLASAPSSRHVRSCSALGCMPPSRFWMLQFYRPLAKDDSNKHGCPNVVWTFPFDCAFRLWRHHARARPAAPTASYARQYRTGAVLGCVKEKVPQKTPYSLAGAAGGSHRWRWRGASRAGPRSGELGTESRTGRPPRTCAGPGAQALTPACRAAKYYGCL